MTIHELAAQLRAKHREFVKDHSTYEPRNHILFDFRNPRHPYEPRWTVAGMNVDWMLHDAYAVGAFSLPAFDTFRSPQVADLSRHKDEVAGRGEMLKLLMAWLEDRGYKVCSPDSLRNPFERLAEALVLCSQKKPAKPGIKPSRLKANASRDRALAANDTLDTPLKQHKWLKENDTEEGYTLPRFSTWARYLRDYDLAMTGAQRGPRGGRTGRNITSADRM
jgi:hypothetical protein